MEKIKLLESEITKLEHKSSKYRGFRGDAYPESGMKILNEINDLKIQIEILKIQLKYER